MPIYRVTQRLRSDTGRWAVGEVFTDKDMKAKTISTLLRVEAIAEVFAPPLAALPGWEKRARALAQLGITDSVEFFDADAEEVASKLGVEPEAIRQCQQEVLGWLTIDAKE